MVDEGLDTLRLLVAAVRWVEILKGLNPDSLPTVGVIF
jgi:hypothetical protein